MFISTSIILFRVTSSVDSSWHWHHPCVQKCQAGANNWVTYGLTVDISWILMITISRVYSWKRACKPTIPGEVPHCYIYIYWWYLLKKKSIMKQEPNTKQVSGWIMLNAVSYPLVFFAMENRINRVGFSFGTWSTFMVGLMPLLMLYAISLLILRWFAMQIVKHLSVLRFLRVRMNARKISSSTNWLPTFIGEIEKTSIIRGSFRMAGSSRLSRWLF